MPVPHEETSKYGVIAPDEEIRKGLYGVDSFVEKPQPEDAPSDLAIIGRYLLKPEIFDLLEKQKPDLGNEVQLTDAIDELNETQRVFAHEFSGKRFDVGNKMGMLEANIEYGLQHSEIKDELKAYLKEVVGRF